VGAEVAEVCEFERRYVGRLEHHRGRHTGAEGFGPAGGAKTPLVTGPEPRESELRTRRTQVVSGGAREGEELGGDPRTHHMDASVLSSGVAASVPKETSEGVSRALLQFGTQDVRRHGGLRRGFEEGRRE
jgi:hypothetical protein